MSIEILSTFSGGGLLDIGFLNQGFQIAKSIENNGHFIEAYNSGISNYLKTTTRNLVIGNSITFNKIEKEIDAGSYYFQNQIANELKGISGIIGGPPCQDFSNGGKHKGVTGERGKLIYSYLNIVSKISPDFIFFENVPSLYETKFHQTAFYALVKRLQSNGYHVWYDVLNALDYGVPQDRPRITLVGFKEKVVKKLLKNNFKLVNENKSSEELVFRWPKKRFVSPKKIQWPGIWKFKGEINETEIDLIPKSYRGLTVIDAFSGLTSNSPNQSEHFEPYSDKFWNIGEGDTRSKSFKRLHRYRYSPTVAYGNNEVHLHPTKARRLTVREALRLQSVPDNYILPKDLHLTAKFKLISNGVPTKKAELIAKEVRRTLEIYHSLK